jgi:hypothetical protein
MNSKHQPSKHLGKLPTQALLKIYNVAVTISGKSVYLLSYLAPYFPSDISSLADPESGKLIIRNAKLYKGVNLNALSIGMYPRFTKSL